jgi:hypothetical protein
MDVHCGAAELAQRDGALEFNIGSLTTTGSALGNVLDIEVVGFGSMSCEPFGAILEMDGLGQGRPR